MSFLSILLVSSAIYFAHARPDSQPWDNAQAKMGPEEKPVPVTPEEKAEPMRDSSDQLQLFGMMQDLNKTVEQHMTPLMSKLDKEKQEEFKIMCMNGFASYINYVLLLIQEKENEKGQSEEGTTGDSSKPRHEVIIQYDTPYEIYPHTPFLADIPYEDDDEDEE